MKVHEYFNLRINQADRMAAKQSGFPSLFYTIKRCYGDNEASNYLRTYKNSMLTRERLVNVFSAR